MYQEFSIWRDKETIQHDVGKLYMMGQANSREKALSQEMGQGWFNHTNCQLTEKVKGRFFPNLYQENRLLLTHHFVYANIFVMILWTVPQSHPFPQPASQLFSCQEALMGTKLIEKCIQDFRISCLLHPETCPRKHLDFISIILWAYKTEAPQTWGFTQIFVIVYICTISWDKAFSREFACPIIYNSPRSCWIVSLSLHIENSRDMPSLFVCLFGFRRPIQSLD